MSRPPSERWPTMAAAAITSVGVYASALALPSPWRLVWVGGAHVVAFLAWCWVGARRSA